MTLTPLEAIGCIIIALILGACGATVIRVWRDCRVKRNPFAKQFKARFLKS